MTLLTSKQKVRLTTFPPTPSSAIHCMETSKQKVDDILTNAGQSSNTILTAIGASGYFCAKVGRKADISKEAAVANAVRGDCVMSVVKVLNVGDGQAVLISLLYGSSLADFKMVKSRIKDQFVVVLLLSGLSAIYSFTKAKMAHCDIKLANFVISGLWRFILIDFGSATPFGALMTSTTRGISFGMDVPST
ncbi:hypothetical protein HK102_005408 [Quaeritorhiza haematococci]|nr:hypothetical protein HK102_005408 [Quaeritorhiza haematococci]